MASFFKYFAITKYHTVYSVLLDEETKDTKIFMMLVCNKNAQHKKNIEFELSYKYIPSLNILELDTRNVSSNLEQMDQMGKIPRILQLMSYYDYELQKNMYYFGYVVLPNKQSFYSEIANKITPIPPTLYTVHFLANKEHCINFK
jgi:hypothetical protein